MKNEFHSTVTASQTADTVSVTVNFHNYPVIGDASTNAHV